MFRAKQAGHRRWVEPRHKKGRRLSLLRGGVRSQTFSGIDQGHDDEAKQISQLTDSRGLAQPDF